MEAIRHFTRVDAHITFCGHVHVPMLYHMSTTAKVGAFSPVADNDIPLLPTRTWLAVIGAVGQPRDGVAAANYAVFDTARQTLRYLRVPYDTATAARKVREAGLPEKLALRLEQGRWRMRWRLEPGMVIDGFELQEHLGTGGMAQLWAVAREGDPTPLVMKIPLLLDSDDPLPIVCFETEQMIMPRLPARMCPASSRRVRSSPCPTSSWSGFRANR